MPNWEQLVEYTAECTPGPWQFVSVDERGGTYAVVRGAGSGPDSITIAEVTRTAMWEKANSDKYAACWDCEGEANARLLADAPAMLALLARWANFGNVKGETLESDIEKHSKMFHETEALLRRHVRIGCEPVDAESRARTPEQQEHDAIIRALRREGQ